jgi:hypothetical protein
LAGAAVVVVVVSVAVVALDLADLALKAQLLVLAHLVVVVLPPDLAELALEARLPALAHLVVVAAQLPQLLRSRQSFSASTARISLSPVQPTYARAPSTR